jgi:DME family drug/metabolite transporter
MNILNKNRAGFSILLTSAFFYSLFGVFSKYIGESFAPFYQTWTRTTATLICFVIFGLATRAFVKIKKEDLKWFLVIGGFGSLISAPLFYAFVHLPLGTVLFIHYAAIVITGYILGIIFFKEKITKIDAIALFAALIGLWLVYRGDIHFNQLLPTLAAFSSGIFFSGCLIFSKKISLKYSSTQINTFDWVMTVIVNFFIFLILREKSNTNFVSLGWAANIGHGINSFIASLLSVIGFKYITSSKGSLIMLSEIVFGVLLGFILFKEALNYTTIIGGALIIFSLAIPSISNLLKSKYAKHSAR